MATFAVTFQGEGIFNFALPPGKFSYNRNYETDDVALFWGYKPEEFTELDLVIQASRIAFYRIKRQIEAVEYYSNKGAY